MNPHKCDKECLFVNRDGTIVCRQTGRCYTQFISQNDFKIDHHDLFAAVKTVKTEIRAPRREIVVSTEHIESETKKYLQLLLYSKTRSDLCSKNGDRENDETKGRRHYKRRRKVEIIEFDEREITTITTQIVANVSVLMKTKHNAKLKAILIAILFLKQQGKQYRTQSGELFTIQRSSYLYKNLPSISDLQSFKIPKNLVRIGSNIIQKIVRNI